MCVCIHVCISCLPYGKEMECHLEAHLRSFGETRSNPKLQDITVQYENIKCEPTAMYQSD